MPEMEYHVDKSYYSSGSGCTCVCVLLDELNNNKSLHEFIRSFYCWLNLFLFLLYHTDCIILSEWMSE